MRRGVRVVNVVYLGTERHEVGKVLIVVIVEDTGVFAVRNEPVHRWKVFTLRQFLVQTPKHLNDAQCRCCHWISEITTRR